MRIIRVGIVACLVAASACGDVTEAIDASSMFTVTIAAGGNGGGIVTSTAGGINCGATCSAPLAAGTSVTLHATPNPGSTFVGWNGGSCSGTSDCTFTVSANVSVQAAFGLNNSVVVMLAGSGTGTVTSTPAGIACPGDCSQDYAPGLSVTLTAAAGANSMFMGWTGGGCTGTGPCVVTTDAAVGVTATFVPTTHLLTVIPSGNGAGAVMSGDGMISCGATCVNGYAVGTMVMLIATSSVGSTFTGWSGAGCAGTGSCVVTMNAAQSVVATFTLNSYVLTVTRPGAGTGNVTSTPAGINCGATCSAPFNHGTAVVLTATPSMGSVFTGWSGAGCSGTGTCTVTMTAANTVTATFAIQQYLLMVSKAGTGGGTVTSSPAGISCGVTCMALYNVNTVVTLSAAAGGGSTFAGWSGPCSGTGTCTVTMDAATSVTATFNPISVSITVSKTGLANANATVTSTPAGITCGATCTGSFPLGTVVTLSTTVAGSVFSGWSGAGCSGVGNCTFVANANTTVTASYRPARIAISVSPMSCLRTAGNSADRARTLLLGRGHSAVFASATELDTAAEIAAFDVVVIGGPGANGCAQIDAGTYDGIIDDYIRNAGGGVVGSGWLLFNVQTPPFPNLWADLPTVQSTGYQTGPLAVTPVPGSPITAGLAAFTGEQYIPTGGGPKMGATSLLTVGTASGGASWTVGNGRGVYLGPMYLEDYNSYTNESLLDGTQPAAVELFMRAIEWAGKAR